MKKCWVTLKRVFIIVSGVIVGLLFYAVVIVGTVSISSLTTFSGAAGVTNDKIVSITIDQCGPGGNGIGVGCHAEYVIKTPQKIDAFMAALGPQLFSYAPFYSVWYYNWVCSHGTYVPVGFTALGYRIDVFAFDKKTKNGGHKSFLWLGGFGSVESQILMDQGPDGYPGSQYRGFPPNFVFLPLNFNKVNHILDTFCDGLSATSDN